MEFLDHYFAYGSNLCHDRLQQRVPSATFISKAKLSGYKLRFNKIGIDGSGKGNIEQTSHSKDAVWGAMFQVRQSELSHLDNAESLGVGYERHRLSVHTPQGNIAVFTYIAILKDDNLKPFHWYKAYVIHGALEHGLPESYIQQIKAVSSIPDSDFQRCQKNTFLPDIANLRKT